MIAALFVQESGIYASIPGIDLWPESRDARLYAGPHPVIAHPPCQRWSTLAHIHKHREGRGFGADDGCFASALSSVERWGGVLEHPRGSGAWPAHRLPEPSPDGWTRNLWRPGWACLVEQGHYGHPAPKATLLYYVGRSPPPPLRWGPSVATTTTIELMSSKGPSRSATPPEFAALLIDLANLSRGTP